MDKNALDRHITGNYGDDQFDLPFDGEGEEDEEEDELATLQGWLRDAVAQAQDNPVDYTPTDRMRWEMETNIIWDRVERFVPSRRSEVQIDEDDPQDVQYALALYDIRRDPAALAGLGLLLVDELLKRAGYETPQGGEQ